MTPLGKIRGAAAGFRCVLPAMLLLALPFPGWGQSTLSRSPNIDGTWTSRPGIIHFHLVHRFQVTDPPVRKVLNSPTFLLAAGLPAGIVLGSRYASNSLLVAGEPNEWEAFARISPLQAAHGGTFDLGIQGGYNGTAGSLDAQLIMGRDVGPIRVLAGARAFSAFAGEEGEAAVTGGLVLRLRPHVSLAGDVANLVTADSADTAWSLGLQLEIPYTPHSVSVQVSNANTTTLQGASIGAGGRRWGFEFTVPIRLARYFGPDADNPPQEPRGIEEDPPVSEPASATLVEMTNRLQFLPDTVRIQVGEAVVWRNSSALVHTVTGDPGRAVRAESVHLPPSAQPFHSGEIHPGEEFRHTFPVAGEYQYFCVPHELAGMVGIVIVSGPPLGGS